MPALRNTLGGIDADARRQSAIQSPGPTLVRHRPSSIEMHNLACRMHTCIGTACGHATADRRVKGAKGCFQNTLDTGFGSGVALTLPAAVIGSVVLNTEGNPAN